MYLWFALNRFATAFVCVCVTERGVVTTSLLVPFDSVEKSDAERVGRTVTADRDGCRWRG